MIGRKLDTMVPLGNKQKISFNCSAIGATVSYLKDKSRDKLEHLVSMPGNRLAYSHYRWSSFGSELTIEGFWKERLAKIPYMKSLSRTLQLSRSIWKLGTDLDGLMKP